MKRLGRAGLLLVAIGLVGIAGCNQGGPQIALVEGRVFLDGRPLSGATVSFEPKTGRRSVARTDKNGQFKLRYSSTTDGAIVGEHLVRISTFRGPRLFGQGDGMSEVVPELVPIDYNVNSELTKLVERSWYRPNWFVFYLESAPEEEQS